MRAPFGLTPPIHSCILAPGRLHTEAWEVQAGHAKVCGIAGSARRSGKMNTTLPTILPTFFLNIIYLCIIKKSDTFNPVSYEVRISILICREEWKWRR